MTKDNKSVKIKKAGLLTKIVICILVAYLAMTLFSLRERIRDTEAQVQTLEQKEQDTVQKNTELANAIENRNDPSHIRDIAREKLNLAEPGELIFDIAD